MPRTTNKGDNGRLLFVGRLRHRKGLEDILEAAARLGSDCPKIDIVGDGPFYETLSKRAKALGLFDSRIAFLGSQPSSWIAANAPNYKGMILPFKASSDGLHDTRFLTLKEAMAMGLPVITTNLREIRNIINEDEGLIVEPNDTHQLSKAILKLKTMEAEQTHHMTKRALEHIRSEFSLQAQARTLSSLFEMIGTKSRSAKTSKAA